MSAYLMNLPALDPGKKRANVVVDTPKGSRNKFKFDEKHSVWRLSKVLPLGMSFPFDFGFIPSTRGEDGDPVDVLVLMDEPAFPGCVIAGRLIGVLEAEQTADGETVRNDRLLAVCETPFNPPPYQSIDEVASHVLDEIEHFFVAYNRMEGREFKPLGRGGPEQALSLVKEAMAAVDKKDRRATRQHAAK